MLWKNTCEEEENDKKVVSSLERDIAAKQRRMAKNNNLDSESVSYLSLSYDNLSQRCDRV